MSIALGVAIFAVWIAPDLLWPAYRGHWLFHNVLTGSGGVPPSARSSLLLVLFRAAGSALVVPVAEELFWRAWLMRRLIAPAFERVPLGAYSAEAFWVTAVLFASEHGPFWAVGLVAGIAYNWWMIRTRSLADCILAHTVTNACLAAYVLLAGRWEYWL
jgi:CAAX prenyl protease-like protein